MSEATTNKPTILVVDDSRLMRVAARKILKDDFEILEAEDGEVAWERLQSSPDVTLVMSDLSMPNLDGLGLLKKIRESSHAQLRELPVIIVTGAEDDDGSKKTALGAGASDFITKPFESVQLLARAKTQARQQRTQQALQTSEASNQQLEEQSQVDQLTGLANRRAFVHRLEEDLSYAVRHRTDLTVVAIRVDRYKVMFLRRGKQVAEEILRHLAGLMKEGRRREDTVARIGMDSFGIVLPSANHPGANRVAQQLHAQVEQHDFNINGESIPVTVSIGVSSGNISAESKAETLLAEATGTLDGEQSPDRVPATDAAHAGQQSHTAPDQVPAVGLPDEQPLDSLPEQAAVSTGLDPADTPEAAAPLTATMPAQPAMPTAADVAEALQALSAGAHPAHQTDALVRAIVPLLESWNRGHNGKHTALVAQLNAALQAPGEDTAEESTSPLWAPETA